MLMNQWVSHSAEFPAMVMVCTVWNFNLCMLNHTLFNLYTLLTDGQVQQALEKLMLKYKLIRSMLYNDSNFANSFQDDFN